MKNRTIIFGGFIGILVICLLGVILFEVYLLSNKEENKKADKDNTEVTTEKRVTIDKTLAQIEEMDDDGIETFVIFGVDSRSNSLGKGTRSDSIMVIAVDHENKKVRVASIYRDCMVHIEGHGYEKITHAHSYGGPELALATVNENLDLDAEHYVTVNFNSVADLIDKIGGVEQDIDSAEAGAINNLIDGVNKVRGTNSGHITAAGDYLLDGTQAVAYSRIRYTAGGDYKRSERQRTILFKVFEKAKTLDVNDRITLMEDMLNKVNTNYQSDELAAILYYISSYKIDDMAAFPLVFHGGITDGAWVEVPVTLVDMADSMHEFLYEETDYTPSATVSDYSAVLYNKRSSANNDFSSYIEDEDADNYD